MMSKMGIKNWFKSEETAEKTRGKAGHLSYQDKKDIQSMASEGYTDEDIGAELGRAASTITRYRERVMKEDVSETVQKTKAELDIELAKKKNEIQLMNLDIQLEEMRQRLAAMKEGTDEEDESELSKLLMLILGGSVVGSQAAKAPEQSNAGALPPTTAPPQAPVEAILEPLSNQKVVNYARMLKRMNKKLYVAIERGAITKEEVIEGFHKQNLPLDLADEDLIQIYNHIHKEKQEDVQPTDKPTQSELAQQ